MAGEQIAFRRAALGVPIAEYSRLMDRARVNHGGHGTSVAYPTAVAATSLQGVLVTASATPHTKGVWTELVASTAFASEMLLITLHTTIAVATADTAMLLDIGIGPPTETVLIPDLSIGYLVGPQNTATNQICSQTFIIPIAVAAGTRISARIQAAVVSDDAVVSLQYRAAGTHSAPGIACTAIGANAATSGGLALTTAGTAHVKGAWTELIASTAATYRYLLVAMGCAGTSNTATNAGLVDIGIGAAASETVLIPDLPYIINASEQIAYGGCTLAFTVNIPAGTRIVARYQSTSNSATAKPFVIVYGIT